MRASILNSVATLLATVSLMGCGNDVPGCADRGTKETVSRILAGHITEGTGIIENELKGRVRFAVNNVVMLSHDKGSSRYMCSAIATYSLRDSSLQALNRRDADKTHQHAVWRNWRQLLGLSTADDIEFLVKQLDGASEAKQEQIQEQLAQILNIDEHFDAETLAAEIGYYLNGPALHRREEIQNNVDLLVRGLRARNENTKAIPIEVEFTISKINGGKNIRVQTRSDGDLIQGIQRLEVLLAAATLANQSAASALPSEAHPAHQSAEASPDCASASTQAQKLICSTPQTARADKRFAAIPGGDKATTKHGQELKGQQLLVR